MLTDVSFRRPCGEAERSLRAFTLLELLVVVAILGILSATALPVVRDALVRAGIAATQSDLRVVATGIEAFAADRGRYPHGSDQPPIDFLTNYDAQVALEPLLGTYLPDNPSLLCDRFTRRTASAIDESIALEGSGLPELFGYGYFDYAHFMVPPRRPLTAYGLVSFGPDGKDSGLGLRPLPGIGSLMRGAAYAPSNGLRSGGDLGVFGGNLPFPRHVP